MIDRTREGWVEELENAVEIMQEAGVEIVAYDGVVGAKAYMHSEEWDAVQAGDICPTQLKH